MTEEMAVQQMNEPAKELIVHSDSMFFDTAKFMLAQRVAKVFAASTMVPQHFQNNIPNCIIALNLADRMQVDPFMLFQNMYIVHGNPGIEAKLAIALTNGCGRFEPLQFKHENKEQGDSWKCIAFAKDLKSGKVLESAAVSIKMAKDEGWYNKSGSKWKTMPELMLEYRSAMFFSRVYCPEVLLGLKTREEIYDIVDLSQGQNGTYASPKQKAADLTEKIKNGAAHAENLKAKLDAGDEQVVGYQGLKAEPTEEEIRLQAAQATLEENRRLEQEGPPEEQPPIEKTLFEKINAARSNFEGMVVRFKDTIKNDMTSWERKQLSEKWRRLCPGKAVPFITAVAPPFEQDNEPDVANGRLKYLAQMRKYMEKDSEKYQAVIDDNSTEEDPVNGMNDVRPKDEGAILYFMSQAFGE